MSDVPPDRPVSTLAAASPLATAPSRADPGPSQATVQTRLGRLGIGPNVLTAVALATGFCLVAFIATGGVDLGPNTWTEIALIVVGVLLALAVVVFGAPGRAWGGVTLVLFAALAALTFASIAWSVAPDNSWLAANQTLAYLAAFAGAVALARLTPERWPALLGAVAVAATVVSAYALLVKVFPATLDPSDQLGRLRAPFDYWNATGLMAALGLPPCVWAGARDGPSRAMRALAVPALAILLGVVVLSYSRGALLAAVLGLGCWFAIVPLRLRGALVLALGAAGGAAIAGWATATHALTRDNVALAARTPAGHTFGVVLLVTLALATVAGALMTVGMERVRLPAPIRRATGIALIGLVALLPVAGVAALAASSRGLTGEVSHLWSKLTSTTASIGNNPGRLGQLSNSRPRFWHEGLIVGEHSLIAGVGALGYGTARTRYTTDAYSVTHAHSYLVETFADLGLIGTLLTLALFVAWGIAARRTLSVAPSRDGPGVDHPRERIGMLTLLAIVVVFGVHSLLDWTWFIPGTAVPALACAGWLAGRGPLNAAVGATPRRTLRASPGRAATVIAGVVMALVASWFVWQPLHSAQADAAAVAAASGGNARAAVADEHTATTSDPFAVQPLYDLSAIYTALGDPVGARQAMLDAVSRQPENPDPWLQLGRYELARGQPLEALAALRTAHRLDRGSIEIAQLVAQAGAEAR